MTDPIADLLRESVEVIHRQNTGRPIRCLNCDLTFMRADHYFAHRAQRHTHPSVPR